MVEVADGQHLIFVDQLKWSLLLCHPLPPPPHHHPANRQHCCGEASVSAFLPETNRRPGVQSMIQSVGQCQAWLAHRWQRRPELWRCQSLSSVCNCGKQCLEWCENCLIQIQLDLVGRDRNHWQIGRNTS